MKHYSIFHIGPIALLGIQEDIDDQEILELQQKITEAVKVKNIKGVLVDLSQVEIVDSFLADNLKELALSLEALETRMVVSGLKASAIVALKSLDLGFDKRFVFALDPCRGLEELGFSLVSHSGTKIYSG